MGADRGDSAKGRAAAERKRRLVSALRDNLARRKAQARARKAGTDDSAPDAGGETSERDGDG